MTEFGVEYRATDDMERGLRVNAGVRFYGRRDSVIRSSRSHARA